MESTQRREKCKYHTQQQCLLLQKTVFFLDKTNLYQTSYLKHLFIKERGKTNGGNSEVSSTTMDIRNIGTIIVLLAFKLIRFLKDHKWQWQTLSYLKIQLWADHFAAQVCEAESFGINSKEIDSHRDGVDGKAVLCTFCMNINI